MIKSVLFDLDGVIVDSEPLHFEAHRKALKQFGINITIQDYMEFGVAKGDASLFEEASRKYGVEIDKEEVSKLKKELYRNIFRKRAAPREGFSDLIEKLGDDYTLAITSSGGRDTIEFVIEKFGLGSKFKTIISGDDVKRVKPFPDIYEKALNILGLGSADCIAIEDSESGLLAAKGANIKCIVVPCKFTRKQNFSKADFIFEELGEIIEAKIL
jgi:HAD superfamily hydrolase (TIGR01509 family)